MMNHTKDAKTQRNKDRKWAKKIIKSFLGYKSHLKIGMDNDLIRKIEPRPTNIHDSKINLFKKEKVAYRDKGYFGVKCERYDTTVNR